MSIAAEQGPKVQQEIYQAFGLIKEKRLAEAEELLRKEISETSPPMETALLHSVLGFLYRVKGEAKAAWREYEQAERLMPGDPALKIISARFLIDEFAQYDTALKKAKEVLKLAKGSPSFEHQARTTMGLACLRKGDRKKAVTLFKEILQEGFEGMVSAENIDFHLVEAFMKRNLEKPLCHEFVKKGLALARAKNEAKMITFLEHLLEVFELAPPVEVKNYT
ncbi:MAG: hypothetical protein HYS22_03915 [Deltaproteobacteria bacterium]|nr:hypothetical protein [Deltaproteobacteria bacterium]